MQVIPVALGPSEGKPCQLGHRLAFAPPAAPPAPFLVKHGFGAAAAAVHGSPRLAPAAAAAASSVPRCSGSAALSSPSSSYSCCGNCSSGVAYVVLRCGRGRGRGCAGGRHYCTWRLAATAWGRTPETSAVAAGEVVRGPAAVGAGAFGAALDGAAADHQPQGRRGSGKLRRPLSAAVSPAAPSRLDPPIAATLGAAAEPLPPSPFGAWASASDASVSQRTSEGSRSMEARMEGDPICGGGGGGSCGGAGAGGAWPPAEERLAAVTERLRALPREDHPPVSGRAAAVLVGLFEDRSGVVRVLLTQRSAKLKSHRGEVCLPGGKRDEDDDDDVATALREAQEELGLDPARVTVLCSLPPVLSKHHLSVTPVMALLPPDLVPRPNSHEVAAAFTVPLVVFLGQFTDPRASTGGAAGVDKPRLTAGSAGGGGGGRKAAGRRTRQRPSSSVDDEDQRPKALSWLATEEEDEGAAEGGGGGGAGGAASARGTSRRIGRCIGEDTAFEGVEHVFRDIRWGEHQYRIHSFQYGEYDVWGLTATICIDAARLALGRGARFQERCPGGHHYSAFFWDGAALRVRPCASTAPRALLTGGTAAAVKPARVAAAVDGAGALEAAEAVEATAGRTQQAPASTTG